MMANLMIQIHDVPIVAGINPVNTNALNTMAIVILNTNTSISIHLNILNIKGTQIARTSIPRVGIKISGLKMKGPLLMIWHDSPPHLANQVASSLKFVYFP
jgi:hypothetical protein